MLPKRYSSRRSSTATLSPAAAAMTAAVWAARGAGLANKAVGLRSAQAFASASPCIRPSADSGAAS